MMTGHNAQGSRGSDSGSSVADSLRETLATQIDAIAALGTAAATADLLRAIDDMRQLSARAGFDIAAQIASRLESALASGGRCLLPGYIAALEDALALGNASMQQGRTIMASLAVRGVH